MNKQNSHKRIWIVFAVIGVLVALGYIISSLLHLNDTNTLVSILRHYGAWVAIPFMLLEVVIAPIPGGALPIVLGALYGPTLGALYGWVGNVGGSLIAFWLARRFGTQLLKYMFPNMSLASFESFINKRIITIWMMFIIPIFPVDFICFAMGFSKTTWKQFSVLVTLAYIPHILLLTFLGDFFTHGTVSQRIIIIGITVLILLVGYLIERQMKPKTSNIAEEARV